MNARYAGVCLLDNPYHIDGIYDYEIPVDLWEEVTVGRFVTVPFGIRNQLRIGLVSEIRDTSAYKMTKFIKSLCPENIALDEEMQGLCAFLKSKTLCSTGDAVRTMVPAAAISRLCELYDLTETQIANPSDELKRASDLFVYTYLSEHGETPRKTLREGYGPQVESSLRRLLAEGWIRRRVILREAKEGKTRRMWSLAVSESAAAQLADGMECNEIRLSSEGHRRILSVLLQVAAPMSSAELAAEANASPAQLKALESKGLIMCQEEQVSRNPYTDTPFVGQTPLELNADQTAALSELVALTKTGEPRAALLHGVTGSGKTRVMTALIDELLADGRGVILLLPEIALTPQSVSIFCARYGSRVAVIHSALSTGERYDAYCRIRRGEADVVIGTRSAVFAPVNHLGAIIIDEEQEHTYKSDQNPKYHAKDIARYRCKHHHALMLLASATPSLESYKRAEEGAYSLIRLPNRCGGASLPTVIPVDMRQELQAGNRSELSRRLVEELKVTLDRGEQAILFLNRRGYHRAISCRSCGEPLSCPRCSVAMTYHTRRGDAQGELVCHWCGERRPLPRVCPSCQSEHLAHMGYGTQRAEEELSRLFPSARVLRMDADTTVSKTAYEQMLGAFRRHEADILLGTQMVTKGHDFPHVTLVGVLLADASLYLDDYRAAERTFSMLTQVIGRAGRGELSGRAVIQTSNPDHEIITLACRQDYPTFYAREIRLRRLLCFPPSCDIALLTVSSVLESEALIAAKKLTSELNELREGEVGQKVDMIVFGPFEAPVYRVDNRYRLRMVIKCRQTKETMSLFHALLCRFNTNCGRRVHLSIDFNPSNL